MQVDIYKNKVMQDYLLKNKTKEDLVRIDDTILDTKDHKLKSHVAKNCYWQLQLVVAGYFDNESMKKKMQLPQ